MCRPTQLHALQRWTQDMRITHSRSQRGVLTAMVEVSRSPMISTEVVRCPRPRCQDAAAELHLRRGRDLCVLACTDSGTKRL